MLTTDADLSPPIKLDGLYGFSGRNLRIATHLAGMRLNERHRINGLVVKRVSGPNALVFEVGTRLHESISGVVEILRAAGDAE